MDWATFLSLGGYITAVCGFFFYLSEKSADRVEKTVKEWRDEHKSQMNEWREEHKAQLDKMDKALAKNEDRWFELFKNMSSHQNKLARKN